MLACCLILAAQSQQPIQVEEVRKFSYEASDGRVRLRRIKGTTALFFQSKMSCDVDGSPNAYHPVNDDLSLDVIGSAGGSRRDGLPSGPLVMLPSPEVVVYQHGVPYIQPSGEFKGFYVSETSYQNRDLPEIDPTRYLDARHFQYIVLPNRQVPEAGLGDLAVVYDPSTGRHADAIYGDIGPSTESGEVSLATIQRLGLPCQDGKSSPGQCRDDLFFLVFPGTADEVAKADAWPHAQATIDALAEAEFEKWGGSDRVRQVLTVDPQGGSVQDAGPNRQVYDELAGLLSNKLMRQLDVALPERCGGVRGQRLPCTPELVVQLHSAVAAAQQAVESAETGRSPAETLSGWWAHLHAIDALMMRYPVETIDEIGPPVQEHARIKALLTRILNVRRAALEAHRRSLFDGSG